MLGRGKVGEGRVTVPMSDAVGEFFPKVGEQWIKLGVALIGDGQEMRGCHWTEDESQGLIWWIIFRSVYELEEYQRADGEKSRYLALCEALHTEILCHFKEW